MCRFCWAAYAMAPQVRVTAEAVLEIARRNRPLTSRAGLIATAVADHPEILPILRGLAGLGYHIALSSVKIDAISEEILAILTAQGERALAIAPEAGNERLRRAINKKVSDEMLFDKVRLIARSGITQLKLYLQVGLPGETDGDVDDVVGLVDALRLVFLEEGRKRGRVGTLVPTVNAFIPKPHTPFENEPLDDPAALEEKMKRLDRAFRKMPNVTFRGMPVVEAIWEAYLAKMGPESAPILLEAAAGESVRRLVKTHRDTLDGRRPARQRARASRARRPARRLRPPRAAGRAVGLHREDRSAGSAPPRRAEVGLGSCLQEPGHGVEEDREAARGEVLRARARRRDGADDEPALLRDGHDAVDRRLDLGMSRSVRETEREREIAGAHDEAVDARHGRQVLDLFQRLARLDLRQDERLAVRARDPGFLLLGAEEKAVRAHRREAAEAVRRILRRFHEPPHVVGAPRAGQHDSRHSGVEELQDQLRVEAARPHERREARPFARPHDGRGFDRAGRAVLRVEDVEVEAEEPDRLDEIRLDVRGQEAVHDLTRAEPVLENASCHVPSSDRDALERAVEVVRGGRALQPGSSRGTP